MRPTLLMAALTAVLLCSGSACKRRDRVRLDQTEEEAPQLASVVHVGDPRNAAQLVSGFYGIEQNSWRWTAGKFSVLLRPPRSAATNGAVLKLEFAIPDLSVKQLKTISLSAIVNGTQLAPETYTQAGTFTYSRDVPGSALTGDTVKVDFALDKSLPRTPSDQRELGLVVSSVGLSPK